MSCRSQKVSRAFKENNKMSSSLNFQILSETLPDLAKAKAFKSLSSAITDEKL